MDEREKREIIDAFRDAWSKHADVVSLEAYIIEGDGAKFDLEAYDPFSGTARYAWSWSWDEMRELAGSPAKIASEADYLEETIASDTEADGDSMFVEDVDGRIHFRSDLEE